MMLIFNSTTHPPFTMPSLFDVIDNFDLSTIPFEDEDILREILKNQFENIEGNELFDTSGALFNSFIVDTDNKYYVFSCACKERNVIFSVFLGFPHEEGSISVFREHPSSEGRLLMTEAKWNLFDGHMPATNSSMLHLTHLDTFDKILKNMDIKVNNKDLASYFTFFRKVDCTQGYYIIDHDPHDDQTLVECEATAFLQRDGVSFFVGTRLVVMD